MSGMQSEIQHERALLREYATGLHLDNPHQATWRDVDQKLKSMPVDGFLSHPDDIREVIEHRLGRPISLL